MKLTTILLAILFAFGTAAAVAQRPVPQVKPTPKPTATPDAEAAFKEELTRITLEEDVKWREFTYPANGFKALFPRTPAQKRETLKDEAVGNLRVTMFMAVDETGGYGIGQFYLPYAVKDPAAIKVLFEGMLQGMLVDGFDADEVVSIDHKGRPALLVVGHDSEGNEIEFRAMVEGRNVLFPILIKFQKPLSPDAPAENSTAAVRFLDSIEPLAEVRPPDPAEDPKLRATYRDSVFTSDYFKFSITIPSGWLLVEQSDAEGVQQAQREKLGVKSEVRRNLFTVAGKPLGMERNPTIICNVVKSPGPFATAKGLVLEIRSSLQKDKTYSSVGMPKYETVGGQTFVTLESEAGVSGMSFSQKLFVILRRDHALVFVVTFSDPKDRTAALGAMESINFGRL